MCEMLVRTVDKAPLDTPEAQARISQRGDVITIQEDGWDWSQIERTNPCWTIVKVPGVSIEKMAAFVAHEPGDPIVSKYLRRRHFSFDLDAYAELNTKDKSALSQAKALSLKKQKQPVTDPAVIGAPSGVIGP